MSAPAAGQAPRAGRGDAVVLSASTLGWLARAALAAEVRRSRAAMGQTQEGLEAVALRAAAAEARRDALWARLKDSERKEAYYAELARKDADFLATRDSHRRLRAETQRLFDAAQAAYDSALGGYLLLLHEAERARARTLPAVPAPPPPRRAQGAAWPTTAPSVPARAASYASSARWGAFTPWAPAAFLPASGAAMFRAGT